MWAETRRHWLQAIIEHNNEESEADQEPRVDQKVAYVWQAVPTIRPPVVVDPLCCREVRVGIVGGPDGKREERGSELSRTQHARHEKTQLGAGDSPHCEQRRDAGSNHADRERRPQRNRSVEGVNRGGGGEIAGEPVDLQSEWPEREKDYCAVAEAQPEVVERVGQENRDRRAAGEREAHGEARRPVERPKNGWVPKLVEHGQAVRLPQG